MNPRSLQEILDSSRVIVYQPILEQNEQLFITWNLGEIFEFWSSIDRGHNWYLITRRELGFTPIDFTEAQFLATTWNQSLERIHRNTIVTLH